jgi:hypothetical protein
VTWVFVAHLLQRSAVSDSAAHRQQEYRTNMDAGWCPLMQRTSCRHSSCGPAQQVQLVILQVFV